MTENVSNDVPHVVVHGGIIFWYARCSLFILRQRGILWLGLYVCPQFSKCFLSVSFCPIEQIFNTMVPYHGGNNSS